MPLAGPNEPVDWMFAYKFNDGSFPDPPPPKGSVNGIFGGTPKDYPDGFSQQYVFATSKNPTLVKGAGPIGATLTDPLGATFGQVYLRPGYFYILWNDQFYDDPIETKGSPAGHSKGMAAWNDDGEGFVLQVSTPSWPACGSHLFTRNSQKTIDGATKHLKDSKGKFIELDGNTLGCIDDDDIEVAQHFFCLKLNKDDLVSVLTALTNSSVVTDPTVPALCQNGGPSDVQALVKKMGKGVSSKSIINKTLSTGVRIISKPSSLAVPPWQAISAKLNGLSLRVVSWWASPTIYSTKAGDTPLCWAPGLGTPGDVDIALTGSWAGKNIDLIGDNGGNSNHAKIGISKDESQPICIFGDENQQGTISKGAHACSSSQNGRGGTYYVLNNAGLFGSLTQLFSGRTAGADEASTDLKGIEVKKGSHTAKAVGPISGSDTTPSPGSATAKPKAATKAKAKKAPAKKASKAKPKKAAAKKVVKAKTKKAAPKKVAVKKTVKAKPKKAATKKATAKKPAKKAAKKKSGK